MIWALSLLTALWVLRHARRTRSPALDPNVVGITTALLAALSAVGEAVGTAATAAGQAVGTAAGAVGTALGDAGTAVGQAAGQAGTAVGHALGIGGQGAQVPLSNLQMAAGQAAQLGEPAVIGPASIGQGVGSPSMIGASMTTPSAEAAPASVQGGFGSWLKSPQGQALQKLAGGMGGGGGGGDKEGGGAPPPMPGSHGIGMGQLPPIPQPRQSDLSQILAQRRARLAQLGLGGGGG